jgi:FkbM family methyltransferase
VARKADVFLDVGAYTGLFTLATAAVNPKLLARAFEIVPAVNAALLANIARNGLDERVIAHLEGIGDPATSMRVPSGEEGSALPSFYSSRMHFADGERVSFRSLDSVGDLLGGDVRVVMKIDVEGTENAVFRFGQRFLGRFHPDMLCEVLAGADGSELESLLMAHGYRFYLVRDDQLAAMPAIVPDLRFRDWVFSTRDASELTAIGVPVAGP